MIRDVEKHAIPKKELERVKAQAAERNAKCACTCSCSQSDMASTQAGNLAGAQYDPGGG